MAVLTNYNQLGGLVGDTFGTKSVTRVIADGVYVFNDNSATGTALTDMSVYLRGANTGANILPASNLGNSSGSFTLAAQTSRITFSGSSGASGMGVAAGAVVTNSGTLPLNLATGQVTIATSGRYAIEASINTEASSGNQMVLQLVKNGTTVIATGHEVSRAQGSVISLTHSVDLVATDTLDLRISVSTTQLFIYSLSWTVKQMPITTSVPAGSLTPTTLTRIQAGLSANQTLALNGDVSFDVVAFSGGITMAAGVFSLLAGKTYRLKANLRLGSIASGGPQFAWVNATTNAELVTNAGRSEAAPSSQSNATDGNPTAEVLYTALANMTVKLRYVAIGAGARVEQHSTAIIEELPIASVVSPGSLPVNTAAHVKAQGTNNQGAISGTAGNLVTWVTTQYDTTSSFNGATGTFTAPRTGYYLFNVGLFYGTITGSAPGRTGFIISRNGSQWNNTDTPFHTMNVQISNPTNQAFAASETKFMNAGDTAAVRLILDGVTAATLAGDASRDFIQIDELLSSVF